MSGRPTESTELTPGSVWHPVEDYELRIRGVELSAILQALAAEYEKGQGAYILENLLDAVHCRLGEMLVDTVSDVLRDASSPSSLAMPADNKSRLVIHLFASAGIRHEFWRQ